VKSIKQVIEEVSPVRFFIFTAAIFGLAFILLTPPFEGADESEHFLRAYHISEGHLSAYTNNGRVGGILPDSLSQLINYTTTDPTVPYATHTKYPEGKTKQALLHMPLNPSKAHFTEFPPSSSYSPIPYIPASIGILFARLLHLPAVVTMYAGRLGNLVCWIGLFAISIRLIPRKKWALAFMGLIPMALFQASIINTDVMAIGMLALFMSYILYLRSKAVVITKKHISALLAIGSAMTLSKQIMFVFLPLTLLLPINKKSSARFRWLAYGSVILVPLILFAGWMHITSGLDTSYAVQTHPNAHAQVQLLAHHPRRFLSVLWNTYYFSTGDSIVNSFAGYFGWFDAPLPEIVVTLIYIAMAFILILQPRRYTKSILDKQATYFIGAIFVLYWLAVNASLYIYYSPVGMGIIFGVQGRYFLPLSLLVIPLFYKGGIVAPQATYRRLAIISPIVFLLASVITISVRYY